MRDLQHVTDPEAAASFDLKLRVPSWAEDASAGVNDEPIPLEAINGYAAIHRVWRKGAVTLDPKMSAKRLYAHLNVRMDVGRAALRRGPLIYCVEEVDNPGGPVRALALPRSASLDAAWRKGRFGGAMILTASRKRLVPGAQAAGSLYSTEPPTAQDASLVALPYHLWANRTPASCRCGWPSLRVSAPERAMSAYKGSGGSAPSSPAQKWGHDMRNAIFALMSVAFMLPLAPAPASAQSNPPSGASAAAVPRTGAGVGSSAARTRHRNTLNRQRARATSEHARHVRSSPHN
jgi:Beta-L-arabinofuranosidase, GH127